MSQRLQLLAQRRLALSAELAESRAGVSHARRNLREFRERYALLLLPVAVLALLNPRRTLRLALGAWTLWRAVGAQHSAEALPRR